jgi:hypothetical protein
MARMSRAGEKDGRRGGAALAEGSTRTPIRKAERSRASVWIGAGALALAVAFGAGRFTAEPEPSARARHAASAATSASAAGSAGAQEARATPSPASSSAEDGSGTSASAPAAARDLALPAAMVNAAAAAAPGPTRGYRAVLPPVLLAEYRAEIVAQLEEQRARVLSRCRQEGLPHGQRSATITYNLTFNPSGREVGRGMAQDRRAPAGKLGKCLGLLEAEPITLSPAPGTYVTLRVPVTYP